MLKRFQSFASLNNISMNKRAHMWFHIYRDVSLGQMPKKRFLRQNVNALVILLDVAQSPHRGFNILHPV